MKPLLMVAAASRPLDEGDAGYCLGVRFCDANGVAHMEDLLIKQVRKRHREYAHMKPQEVREALRFDVYEVPDPPRRGGFPKWLGPTEHYK